MKNSKTRYWIVLLNFRKNLKSRDRKEGGEADEVIVLVSYFENTAKDVQKPGKCKCPNISFENNIKQNV